MPSELVGRWRFCCKKIGTSGFFRFGQVLGYSPFAELPTHGRSAAKRVRARATNAAGSTGCNLVAYVTAGHACLHSGCQVKEQMRKASCTESIEELGQAGRLAYTWSLVVLHIGVSENLGYLLLGVLILRILLFRVLY